MTRTATTTDTRVFYRDIKPYAVPENLDDLRGPANGQVTLPLSIYWGPDAEIDLDTLGGIVKAYQALIREGLVADQLNFLNRNRLIEIWPELLLPAKVRERWENLFSELTHTA
ncbi:MAG: transcriptional regulator [Actinomycetales bacterium]|nr:transcriptional regulator [Actinomycetales bacterium]